MTIAGMLFLAWLVLVVFWMSNHYYRENQAYEREYQRGLRPRWHKPTDWEDD